jgi:hypothetical protein
MPGFAADYFRNWKLTEDSHYFFGADLGQNDLQNQFRRQFGPSLKSVHKVMGKKEIPDCQTDR